jgi:hypothetical protein
VPKFQAVFLLVLGVSTSNAAEPFRYPEAKHGDGSLKYVNGVPVLTVAGSPAAMGEQMGQLALRHVQGFPDLLKKAIEAKVGPVGLVAVRVAAKGVFDRFPAEYRAEIEAIAKQSGVDLIDLIVANTVSDLEAIFGCSGIVVEPAKSKTGEVIFGRNLDIPPVAGIHQYSLVVVFQPTGKRPFAAVTMPGFVGVGAGMNDAGLCIGGNTVTQWADGSPKSDPKGMSVMIASREIMQTCATRDDMETWLRKQRTNAPGIVPTADATGGAIFEVTTRTVERVPAERSIACATNHFQSKSLAKPESCRRLEAIAKSRSADKLGVAEVFTLLHEANQGAATMQTILFEPKSLTLHVAFGDGKKSATESERKTVELKDRLGK